MHIQVFVLSLKLQDKTNMCLKKLLYYYCIITCVSETQIKPGSSL